MDDRTLAVIRRMATLAFVGCAGYFFSEGRSGLGWTFVVLAVIA